MNNLQEVPTVTQVTGLSNEAHLNLDSNIVRL